MNRADRPKLKIPITITEIALEFLTIPLVVFNFWIIYECWTSLPANIPTQFGLDGVATSFGPKEALIFIAIGNLSFYILLTALARFPHACNFPWKITSENAEQQYVLVRKLFGTLKLEYSVLFSYCIWSCIQIALEVEPKFNTGDLIMMILLIVATFGVYFFSGYRTR